MAKIEESGIRDVNGVIQITRKEIRVHPKQAGSQRRGRDDFLDKSIKNYLQDKNTKKNAAIQRNKCLETPGRLEKPTRCVGVLVGRQKSQKARSAHQKQWNDVRGDWNKENMIFDRDTGLPYSSHWHQERCGNSGNENKTPWYLKNRDINGNVEILQNGRAIGWENLEKRTVASDGPGFGVMANNFSPQKPPDSNVFGNHTEVPADSFARSNFEQIPRASCGYNSVPNNFQAFKSLAEILEMQRSMSLNGQKFGVENCGSLKIGPPNCFRENGRQLVNLIPNSNELKNHTGNFLAHNEIATYNGNLATNREDPRAVGNLTKNFRNLETSKENNFYANHKVHGDQSFRHDCQDQARFFMECFQFQRTMPVYRHGTHVFDNYFRGPNDRSAHQRKDNQQTSLFPLDKIVPSNSYSTSSFAGYRPGPGYPETAHSRSILG